MLHCVAGVIACKCTLPGIVTGCLPPADGGLGI
jgi:hypothetical protein